MIASARDGRASRDAAAVSTWNLVSRLTGVARVVTLGGALGATRLGDTYQASNQVSNVLFELLAAGTLSAVLVPGLVSRLAQHDANAARAFAGAVLGRSLALLLPLVAVGAIFARPLAGLLFAANDAGSHAAQRRLGAFLLLFVLPQLAFYAWGAIVTATLHAAGRFVAAAVAPVANNVVVSAGLGLFWYRGAKGLELATTDRWLLGATALGGVVAMTAVPALVAWRVGLGVRPRLHGSAELTGVGRDAWWGGLALVPAQIVVFASLLVAARVSGGVAAYQIAFTFFLLPHALVGQPTATVLYPRLARAAANGSMRAFRAIGGSGFDLTAALLLFAGSLTVALAPWLVRVIAVGALDDADGRRLTATALAWLGIGLPAYGVVLLLTRVGYAAGDLHSPALSAITGAIAALAVLAAALVPSSPSRVVALIGLAHTAMVLLSAAVLLVRLARAERIDTHPARVVRFAVAALGAGGAARLVASQMVADPPRLMAMVTVALAALVGVGAYGAILYALGERSVPRLEGDPA